MRRCSATRDSRKQLCIPSRKCRNKFLFRKNRKLQYEEKSQTVPQEKSGSRQESIFERQRQGIARTSRLPFEGRRGARSFHGCCREFSRGKARRLYRRTPAYRLATFGA